MKIKHQYLIIVLSALFCMVVILWTGRSYFIEAVSENQNLVQDQLDPLIRVQFPSIEVEHNNIELLLKAESKWSSAFFTALRLNDNVVVDDLKTYETSMKSSLEESKQCLSGFSGELTREMQNQIKTLSELHDQFEGILNRIDTVSILIADELENRNHWKQLSAERFAPFRQSLDILGEHINQSLATFQNGNRKDWENALSLVLNADRDCYQCFLAEYRVSADVDPQQFRYWLSFHNENTQQINHRLGVVERLGLTPGDTTWSEINRKKDEWIEATSQVVEISERNNQFLFEKKQLLSDAETTYSALKTKLNDTILLFESRIGLIQADVEKTRSRALSSMNVLKEKSDRYIWILNSFFVLLSVVVVVLLWFPRRLISQMSYVSEYLHDLTDEHLDATFEMPSKIAPHKGSEMEMLCVSINRMRSNLVEAMNEQKRMIDRLNEAKLQAQAAGAAKDEFLSVMSHELRTPLNPIVGYSEYLKSETTDPELQEYLTAIDDSAKALTNLIDNILDYTRIHKQIVDCHLEFFDYRSLIKRCCDSELKRGRRDSIDFGSYHRLIKFPRHDTLVRFIETDQEMLKQVVTVLLSNAFKFTDEGVVSLNSVLEYVEEGLARLSVYVTDTGIGISDEQQSRIFEPFHLVDSSTTRQYGGIGLSLAICDLVVRKLGGKLNCKSELGKGSEFWFSIPVAYKEVPLTETASVEKKSEWVRKEKVIF